MNKYIETLDAIAKARYLQKLAVVNGKDPYQIPLQQWSEDLELLPRVSYPDIVNYLIFTPSSYTSESLKAWKSTEAYNQFVSGWVREIKVTIEDNVVIVTGKVMHSQRLNEKPLQPWVINKQNGVVLSAHCNCMAGLGEACTHIAAILFAIDAAVKMRESKTVTEKKAYWKIPGKLNQVKYATISNIDFTSAKKKKEELDSRVNGEASSHSTKMCDTGMQRNTRQLVFPLEEEKIVFLTKLGNCGIKPAIHSVIPPFSKKYIPKPLSLDLPPVLTNLFSKECCSMTYEDLVKHCATVNITVTSEQALNIEEATRAQYKSKLWFKYRAGRITASKFKDACNASLTKPSLSLINGICNPVSNAFTSLATNWGIKNENEARNQYIHIMKETHVNFSVKECGLILNSMYSYLGATPDGKTCCDCCGVGVLEIKCPYSIRKQKIDEVKSKFCLVKKGNDLVLDKQHKYYYQIQCQIHLSKVEFSDFVVWTTKDIHIERVKKDDTFWNDAVCKSDSFFRKCILPELVGKYYTQLKAENKY